MASSDKIRITDLEFDDIKENLKTFLKKLELFLFLMRLQVGLECALEDFI